MRNRTIPTDPAMLIPMTSTTNVIELDSEYKIKFPETSYIIVIAGAKYGTPAMNFRHPNVAASEDALFQYKHYRASGSKFWTSAIGRDFYFVIPKESITVIREKGYSYIPVVMGGMRTVLSVSGGGCHGWTAVFGTCASLGTGWSASSLKKLADIAIAPAQCRSMNVRIPLREISKDYAVPLYRRILAQNMFKSKLDKGHKLWLFGRSLNGVEGPFLVRSRNQQKGSVIHLTKLDGSVKVSKGRDKHPWWMFEYDNNPWRAAIDHIDWLKTAEENGIVVPNPQATDFTLSGS